LSGKLKEPPVADVRTSCLEVYISGDVVHWLALIIAGSLQRTIVTRPDIVMLELGLDKALDEVLDDMADEKTVVDELGPDAPTIWL
jgi:hypothetical protein